MALPDCPECGEKLSLGNVTVNGSQGPITPPEVMQFLVNVEDDMQNVVVECSNCDYSFTRIITVRTG